MVIGLQMKKGIFHMSNYILKITPDKNNIHVLHEIECPYTPDEHSIKIGYHVYSSSALRHIRIKKPNLNVSGCKYCCRSCCSKK